MTRPGSLNLDLLPLNQGCVMSYQSVGVLKDVSFRYPRAHYPVFESLAFHFSTGFTGVLDASRWAHYRSPQPGGVAPAGGDLCREAVLLAEARSLNADELGVLMNPVSQLNSRPERLLRLEIRIPREICKLPLALNVARTRYLIVIVERNTHLDLPAINRHSDGDAYLRVG